MGRNLGIWPHWMAAHACVNDNSGMYHKQHEMAQIIILDYSLYLSRGLLTTCCQQTFRPEKSVDNQLSPATSKKSSDNQLYYFLNPLYSLFHKFRQISNRFINKNRYVLGYNYCDDARDYMMLGVRFLTNHMVHIFLF